MLRGISVLAIGLMAMTAKVSFAAPLDPSTIRLPEERLTLIAGNSMGAIFIAPDSIKWTGRAAEVLTYKLLQPGNPIGDGKTFVEEVEFKRFDCAAQTYQSLGSAGFDATGANIVSLPEEPQAPIRERTMTARLAGVVCGQVQLPPGNTAKDRATAKAMALQALSTQR